jgi:uncharacterized protein
MTNHDLPPCLIFIDKEGRWFHQGAEMIHREFIHLFYEHLEIDSLGRYIIQLGRERCYLEVEDTPFVVQRAVFKEPEQTASSRFILFLSDDTQENLLADTLFVGRENVLYCRVKGGRFPARFSRPAYYQLADHIQEEGGQYVLPLAGKRFMIQQPQDKNSGEN